MPGVFAFEGGRQLTTMGAGWFVSFCYHEHIDSEHKNWDMVPKTVSSRSSAYARTRNFHAYWLKIIVTMSDDNLNKNKIDLTAPEIKSMVKKLLESGKL